MKFVYKRSTKKLRKLKFHCTRCKCKFLADLIPDCECQYSEFLSNPEKDFLEGFVKIKTTCPNCGMVLNYDKNIVLYKNGVPVL